MTCFWDEESSSLDPDKAEKFIKMYISLMKTGVPKSAALHKSNPIIPEKTACLSRNPIFNPPIHDPSVLYKSLRPARIFRSAR